MFHCRTIYNHRVESIDAVTDEILFFADSTHGVINCRDQQHLRVFSANLVQFFYHFGAQFRRLLNFKSRLATLALPITATISATCALSVFAISLASAQVI